MSETTDEKSGEVSPITAVNKEMIEQVYQAMLTAGNTEVDVLLSGEHDVNKAALLFEAANMLSAATIGYLLAHIEDAEMRQLNLKRAVALFRMAASEAITIALEGALNADKPAPEPAPGEGNDAA